jgi:hypothetical protein
VGDVCCGLLSTKWLAGQQWRVRRTDKASCEVWLMRGVRSSPLVASWLTELMGLCLQLLGAACQAQ